MQPSSMHTMTPCLLILATVLVLDLTTLCSCARSLSGHGSYTPGHMFCNGRRVGDSEVIYWRLVYADMEYQSPISPHRGEHHDRYMTYQWDGAGLNNLRINLESNVVIAHALGRTLVLPPAQHLFGDRGGEAFGEADGRAQDIRLGFDDLFHVRRMFRQKGFHIITMDEFLEKEGLTGSLHGALPPGNNTHLWGHDLWHYLNTTADERPEWGKSQINGQEIFLALPDRPDDFELANHNDPKVQERLKKFAGGRHPRYYTEALRNAHHIHVPNWGGNFRIFEHFYTFVFFADPKMQAFYRRFVRDFLRFKDPIQCAGAEMVAAVRADARKEDPGNTRGDYYALHIRRTDFHMPAMNSAAEIVENLKQLDGTPIIPRGALVYIATDDPDGACLRCKLPDQTPCVRGENGRFPEGCMQDPSWKAFEAAGWKIRFARDYLKKGLIADLNPKFHGMVDAIVCSRAKAFSGTMDSTATGYIHRLRGYHGLSNASYYHRKGSVFDQVNHKEGYGWNREWPSAWTDVDGNPL